MPIIEGHTYTLPCPYRKVIFLIPVSFFPIYRLSKSYLFVSACFQSLEVIGVSRDNTKSRQVAVKELQYRAVTTRGQWPHVCIFPEGNM